MKMLTLFFTLLATLHLHSKPKEIYVQIAGKSKKFYQYDEQNILMNKKCPQLEKGQFCSYLFFLKSINTSGVKNLIGGISPGSEVCSAKLNGVIVMGTTGQIESQISFCKINTLYIDVGTITYYLNH